MTEETSRAKAICVECGHSKDSHIDKWGGICVGCPCSGFKSKADIGKTTKDEE